MAWRIVVLGACCSGKSSLCEQLRVDRRSVIEAAREALAMTDVIFLTSWVPTEMLRGFGLVFR